MSNASETLLRMVESLPEPVQERILAEVQDFLEDMKDQGEWDARFSSTQSGLAAAASRVREEIAKAGSSPFDHERL